MTARHFFKTCQAAGIHLEPNGGKVRWKGPMTPALKAELLRIKPELLAMLKGDYAKAGLELVLRETRPGEQRFELVEMFDERLAICMIDGLLDYGQAAKLAYISIAKEIERINHAATAAEGKAP